MLKMYIRLITYLNRMVCFGVAFLSGAVAYAQSCVEGDLKLAPEDISSITDKFITGSLGSGIILTDEVVALAISDINALETILRASEGATDAQKAAIGAGLARAAQACVVTQPEFAAQIQELVVGAADEVILAAFEAAAGEIATAAIGTASSFIVTPSDNGSSNGGSIGGSTNAGGTAAGSGNGSSSATVASSFSTPSFSGGTTATSAETTASSTVTSDSTVSPST